MQNELKYGKISELCDIDGYVGGEKMKINCACGDKYFLLRGEKFKHIFLGVGKEFNF